MNDVSTNKKIAIVSLGCPKNQVDADVFCRSLLEAGWTTVAETTEADIVLINTCGFIESAKSEAIECILDACMLKRERPELKVVVTGCLAERYREEIPKEIPEVDAIIGIGRNTEIAKILHSLLAKEEKTGVKRKSLQCYGPKQDLPLGGARIISTPGHYAWLKIAEGCSNVCSYCAIPMIRGAFRSRTIEDCVNEARWLADQGVRELVLVAQDVTAFGTDRGKNEIAALLDALNQVEGLEWIRLLYCYPERIDEAFIDAISRNDKVLPYIDLPIQHVSETILHSMHRRGGAKAIRNAISLIRERLPEATLRTSLIAGYPGETEEDFQQLYDFVVETRFDRLGCFAFSPEEDTPAFTMPGLPPVEERERRAETIMRLQGTILMEKQENMAGKTMNVICDDFDPELEKWRCRSLGDAPEIDLNVLVSGEEMLQPGAFYQVKITGNMAWDLVGDIDNDALYR